MHCHSKVMYIFRAFINRNPLFGALAASLIPFTVDVDDSNPEKKKTSVKALLYSIDLTTTPSGDEEKPEKTNVSISVPGLLGDLIGKCKCKRDIPDEMVEEIAEKLNQETDTQEETAEPEEPAEAEQPAEE